jgi:hypothetical protein
MPDTPTASFTATLEQMGTSATGIVVPDSAVQAMGHGRKPAVVVTIGDYSYRSTVAVMGGRNLLPFAAEHRAATGFEAGARLEVTLVLDTAPRVIELPDDLAKALEQADARAAWAALSYSVQRGHVMSVDGAKAADTRARRIQKVVDSVG